MSEKRQNIVIEERKSDWFGFFDLMAYQPLSVIECQSHSQQWYYLTHCWEDKWVHTFRKGICLRVNVIARLEFELVYYDFTLHFFNHYTTKTPPERLSEKRKKEAQKIVTDESNK